MNRVVIIDDDRSVREIVRRSLEKDDLQGFTAEDADAGLDLIRSEDPDVVLLDVMLPGASGLEVFEEIRSIDRGRPIIFMTAGTDSETAIKAMQLGGFDYVTKPLDLPDLNRLVLDAVDTRRMMKKTVAIPTGNTGIAASGDAFVGSSPAMIDVYKAIGRVSAQNVPVLIRGESGTGKELVARAICQHSDRDKEPFIAVNCAALPDTLLESELFGHEKGSFTGAQRQRIGKFEACNGGTIFLDEVGDMSPLVQGKVLRLLQEQKFERVGGNETIETDVRIITATNRDLEQMVAEGEFREDLFYRLNGVTVALPPLRARGDDIQLLLEHYLTLSCRDMNKSHVEGIAPEALEILRAYRWPGNVRELRSVIRQALLNTTGPVIVPSCLPTDVISGRTPSDSEDEASGPSHDLSQFVDGRLTQGSTDLYAETLEMMERFLITRVLQKTRGNQTQAADILGITRGKIRDRVNTFGISIDKEVSLDD